MDAFNLQSLDETRPIIEQLLDIVDQVNNEDRIWMLDLWSG